MIEGDPRPAQRVRRAADALRELGAPTPSLGVVLGSGFGQIAEQLDARGSLSFYEIPFHPRTSVPGHAGRVLVGTLGELPVALWAGRVHLYEGWSAEQVTFPVRVMQALGARAVLLTNAAGSLNASLRPGDLMLISDHVNLLALIGHSPLRGPEDTELGPRFVSMVDAYDAELRTMVLDAAEKAGIAIVEGVYVMVGGPNYETPAEARFLRQLGDAVGMSTASEVIAARQLGLRVMAISGITNAVAMQPGQPGADHEEVLASGALLAPRLSALLQVLVPELCTVL